MSEPLRDRTSMLASLLVAGLLAACGGSGGDRTATAQQAGNAAAAATPAAVDAGSATASWNFCASERGMCNFSGTRKVRYGIDGFYKYANYTGGVRCANGVFGDPVPGKPKACSVSVAPVADAGTAPPQTPPKAKEGSITLAWIAPQSNADGSPLTDLAGYRVRWGTRAGSYSGMAQLDNPHALSHVLRGLPASTYYIVVTAYNATNTESTASAEVSKSIR